jgi:predicted HTH transcriptional regulator
MNNVAEVLKKLTAKQFDALIGTPEGAWLDAKESPYVLETPKQKLKLAKDVASLANAVGGIIVLGLSPWKHR